MTDPFKFIEGDSSSAIQGIKGISSFLLIREIVFNISLLARYQ
uniref:Uncharacterized protein n=1 Tax=Manihot esculenta TaxID=3983 RepID=A0A2C9UGP0_MANES